MKSHVLYIKIIAMLAIIAVGAMGLSYGLHIGTPAKTPPVSNPTASDGTFTIVTSFYPIYTMTAMIADGIDGVEVINLVDNHVGCLHDYQMTVEDRKTLEKADVLVINGAGAEPFLEAALDTMPDLKVIDLSAVLDDLIASCDDHSHDHDHGHADGVNSHTWVSPRQYAVMFNHLSLLLSKLDPSHVSDYTARSVPHQEQIINPMVHRVETAAAAFHGVPTVLLHDSMAYLARDLGLNVVASLNVGEESAVDSHALKEAEEVLRSCDRALILGDAQYGTDSYLTELCEDTTVIAVDIVVSGEEASTAWVDAMTALSESLEAAV
ncbi:MAG: metal ABC transporter substrate-binding protein [Clostridia bacterium]|nr:metal ABC transporter substrate-binding protein [Clostridia bacterium]